MAGLKAARRVVRPLFLSAVSVQVAGPRQEEQTRRLLGELQGSQQGVRRSFAAVRCREPPHLSEA